MNPKLEQRQGSNCEEKKIDQFLVFREKCIGFNQQCYDICDSERKGKKRLENQLWIWENKKFDEKQLLFFRNYMKRVLKDKSDNSLLLVNRCVNENDFIYFQDSSKFSNLSEYWKMIFAVFEKIVDQIYFSYFKNCLVFLNSKTEHQVFKVQNVANGEFINIQSLQAAMSINCSMSYFIKLREKRPQFKQFKVTYLRIEHTVQEQIDLWTQKVLFRGVYNQQYQKEFEDNIQYICMCSQLLSENTSSFSTQHFQNANTKMHEFYRKSQYGQQNEVNKFLKQESNVIQNELSQMIEKVIQNIREFGSSYVVVTYPFDMESEDALNNLNLESHDRLFFTKQMFKNLIQNLQKITGNRVMLITTSDNFTINNNETQNGDNQEIKENQRKNIKNKIVEAIKLLNNEYEAILDLSMNDTQSQLSNNGILNLNSSSSQQSNQYLDDEEDLSKMNGSSSNFNKNDNQHQQPSNYFQYSDLDQIDTSDIEQVENGNREQSSKQYKFSNSIQKDFNKPIAITSLNSQLNRVQGNLTLPKLEQNVLIHKPTQILPMHITVTEIIPPQPIQQEQQQIQKQQGQSQQKEVHENQIQNDKYNNEILEQKTIYILSISGSIRKLIQVPSNPQVDSLIEFNFLIQKNVEDEPKKIITTVDYNCTCVRVMNEEIEIFFTISKECYGTNQHILGLDQFSIYTIKVDKNLQSIRGAEKLIGLDYNKDKLVQRHITCDDDYIYLLNGLENKDTQTQQESRACERLNLATKMNELIPECDFYDQQQLQQYPIYLFTTKENIFYGGIINQEENNDDVNQSTESPIHTLQMQAYNKQKNCWFKFSTNIKQNKSYIFAPSSKKNAFYYFLQGKKNIFSVQLVQFDQNGKPQADSLGTLIVNLDEKQKKEFIVTSSNICDKIIISSIQHQYREIDILNNIKQKK